MSFFIDQSSKRQKTEFAVNDLVCSKSFPISSLPEEMLMTIFSFLKGKDKLSVSLSQKKWNILLKDEMQTYYQFFAEVFVSKFGYPPVRQDGLIAIYKQHMAGEWKNSAKLTDEDVKNFSSKGLDCKKTRIYKEGIKFTKFIEQKWGDIQYLAEYSLLGKLQTVDDNIIEKHAIALIEGKYPDMGIFDYAFNTKLCNQNLSNQFREYSHTFKLRLYRWDNVNPYELFNGLEQLKHLTNLDCKFGVYSQENRNNKIEYTYENIMDNFGHTHSGIIYLDLLPSIGQLSNLKELSLDFREPLSDIEKKRFEDGEQLSWSFLKECKHLKSLWIYGFGDCIELTQGFVQGLSNLNSLEELSLLQYSTDADSITPEAIDFSKEIIETVQLSLKNLNSLNLSNAALTEASELTRFSNSIGEINSGGLIPGTQTKLIFEP